jgi:hypothetical protein
MARKLGWLAAALAAILGFGSAGFPQARYHEAEQLVADVTSHRQPPPGTEFVFARVRFTSHGPGRRNFGPIRDCIPDDTHYGARICGWAHDYPDGEQHILQIADEATGINLNRESYVIVSLESEELFQYPFAYFSEVGEMTMSEKEVEHLREFFNRGGFAIADDLDEGSLYWFENEMRRVFPNRAPVELTIDNPVFHTFYDIPALSVQPPYEQTGPTRFVGYFDERGRLIMLLNVNNDLGDYWEWIDQPEFPLPPSTEALRFGINYLLYSLTH